MSEVNANTVVTNEVVPATVSGRKSGRKPDPNSKYSQARSIYQRLAGSPAKDVKAAFVSELGLPKGSANTYYHSLVREGSRS
jgi:hypothetical protein